MAVFLRGDKVLLILPADPSKGLEIETIECGVLKGDTGREGDLIRADTYILQTRQASTAHGIREGQTLSGIKREQMTHL